MDYITHLKKYLSEKDIDLLNTAVEDKPKHAALLNSEKISDEEFISLFPNVKKHPIVPHCFLYNNEEYQLGKNIYHDAGAYYLLEPCSPLVSYYLNPQKGMRVLDIAAAPGGKCLHASILMENDGVIIGNEINQNRAHILLSNVEKLGRKNILITSNNINQLRKKYFEFFDRIILDAPCSGSGMFRKDELMEKDWTYEKVLRCQSIQKDLIIKAFEMLKKGGIMTYSTCSFSYEEDEEIIKFLLENKEDAKIVPLPDNKHFYQSDVKGTIHLFPYLFEGEGHYLALIQKKGDLVFSKEKVTQDKSTRNYVTNEFKDTSLKLFNDAIYSLPFDVNTNGLYVLRYGVKIGELKKNVFLFDHAFAHAANHFDNYYDLSEEELKKYLHGEVLNNVDVKDGMVILRYHHLNIGLGKAKSKVIKNHYPKGLRH